MNRKLVICAVATAFYLFVFGFLAHGIVLEGMYSEMGGLIRPQDEAMGLTGWIVLAYLIQGYVLSALYLGRTGNEGVAGGLRFGLMAGLLFASVTLIMYAVNPYTGAQTAAWFVTDVIHYTSAGLVLALLAPRLK